MSVCVLVISLALSGQLTSDERYGMPASEPAAVSAPPSPFDLNGNGQGSNDQSVLGNTPKATPPPPLAPAARATLPASTPGFGYSSPTKQTSAPPAAANVSKEAPSVKPATMMHSMLTPPNGSRLSGRPVRLAEVLVGASSREQQSQRVAAYWDLCSSVADYYLGVREQDELQRLRGSVPSVGAAWQQAESELGVRIATSQRAAVASQYRLASLIGEADASNLPLPSDLPHCGDYYARYDQVFAGRESPEARELSELLPMRYQELSDASLAVTRAEQFLAAIVAQRGGGDGTGTLRALELLALRRRAFVQIARDYNCRIVRYTELATPGEIDSDRLIGMLIMRVESTNTATRPATLVPPPNRQSQNSSSNPAQTFAEGWESIQSTSAAVPRDDAVKPASAEAKTARPRREHSLLVPSE